ncbi:MAG: hypothetical protein CMK89_20670 [Pseudomonadales bacterium]|nr:hypothetical protein [Pseudomonadales bacterium]
MKLSLKDAFQAHYEAEQLNVDQLAELNRLMGMAKADPFTGNNKRLSRRALLTSVAMVMLLVLFGGGLHQSLDGVFYSMPERIAAEVAKNHLKMRPLELKTESMVAVQHYFTALDFMPTESALFGGDRELLGGRYCSIQGITAAQLRYQNSDQELVTLYETQYDPKTFKDLPDIDKGEMPLLMYSRGLQVKIWVEKDVLMVEAVK